MKRVFLVLFLSIMTLIAGCSKDPVTPETPQQPEEPEKEIPSISIKTVKTDNSSITFEAEIKNAEKAAYVLLQENEKEPEAAAILKNGNAIPVSGQTAAVKIENLKGDSLYRIIAAANNGQEFSTSNILKVKTDKNPQVEIQVEILETTFESVAFKVVHKNAEKISYMILPATDDNPTVEEVLGRGEKIDPASTDRIEAGKLKDLTEYKLLIAAKGYDQEIISTPQTFKTKEDESKIIKKEYNYAIATVSENNYYVQFLMKDSEYEVLSLDFYAEGGKYLPAGTYDVKDIDSPTGIGMQFSKVGTRSFGKKLTKGTAEVTMDKAAGIYSFHVDVLIEDGRHVVADFEGEIKNMPIRETIEFNVSDITASASDEGWNIQVNNSDKNEKIQLSIASESDQYLEEGKYELTEQNSGTYYNASSEQFPFKTGEFNAVIDWTKLIYQISFEGTLEDRTLITFTYTGKIQGMEIQKPSTANELIFTEATGFDFGGGNFFIKLLNSDDNFNAVTLDFYCEPTDFLQEGTYVYGKSTPGYFSDSSKLSYTEHDFLYFTEGTAVVSYSGENFVIDFTATVEDGRVFHTRYEGPITGMTTPNN